MTLRLLLPPLAFLVGCGAIAAAAQEPSSPAPSAEPSRVVLVELFTSEGCSSCPPADDLLRKIDRKRTPAGQLLVGLSEHVTYWNQGGWTDRFSAQAFTDRQSRYAERLHVDEVYTPQMVINGREQILGSKGPALLAALQHEEQSPSVPLQILSVQRNDSSLTVRFRVGALPGTKPLDVIAVIADDTDSSQVGRGENAGHVLQHAAVARSLARVATVHEAGEQEVQVPVKAPDSTSANSPHHLVLFVQEPHVGQVFGAAVHSLP